MAVIGGRNVGTNDLVVIGAGVVMFIDSFLPWYGGSVSSKVINYSSSVNGWGSQFGAWFPILLVMAVAALTAARVFAAPSLPRIANGAVSWLLVAAAVSALAALIILIRWVSYPDAPSAAALGSADISASAGAKFGTYLGLILAIVQAVFGYLSLVAAGEKLPWQKRTV